MDQSKVAVRYAKAFYESSSEQGRLSNARADMELIAKTIASVPEFKRLLDNPIIRPSQKSDALVAMLTEKVSDLTISFVRLVVANKRETQLGAITRNFLHRYKKENGIAEVVISSARQMEKDAVDKLVGIVESSLNIKAELEQNTNSSLIGGFVLRVGDVQFDSSIATKLKNIKHSLLN